MEIGTLLLQREVLEKALTPYFNALLSRREVTVGACASPAGGGSSAFRPSQLVRLGVPSASNGAPLGSLWGIQAPAVQPLDVRLQVMCSYHLMTILTVSRASQGPQCIVHSLAPESRSGNPQMLKQTLIAGAETLRC